MSNDTNGDLIERAALLVQIYKLEHSFEALDELEDRLTTQLTLYHLQDGEDDDPGWPPMEEVQEHLETLRAIKEIHERALLKKSGE